MGQKEEGMEKKAGKRSGRVSTEEKCPKRVQKK